MFVCSIIVECRKKPKSAVKNTFWVGSVAADPALFGVYYPVAHRLRGGSNQNEGYPYKVNGCNNRTKLSEATETRKRRCKLSGISMHGLILIAPTKSL